jgi:two-component system sensor histidine kinase CpxA
MKSLYLKVLVWSIATVVVAMSGLFIHSRFSPRRAGPPFQNARMLADVAQRVYAAEGRPGLQLFLSQPAEDPSSEYFIADAAGRDLLSGDDRSMLLRQRAEGPNRFWFLSPPAGRMVFVAPSSDGSIRWITVVNADPNSRSSPSDAFIWILAAVALLAYLFTFYLVSPLRKLAAVVERFGSGDLTARARTTRRDELGHLARAFDNMAERIDTLVTTERRLLQDISHELRTPLARMRFAVEVARADPNQQDALDRIRKECDRLALLTDELLEISVADGDPANRQFEVEDLEAFLQEIIADATIEATARNLRMALRSPAPISASIDRELLRRAVDNVLRNAIRHSPPGETIDIELAAAAGQIRIAIRDRGPGVPQDMLGKIFQPFFRVDDHRSRTAESGGVGLGLAIARRAIQWHHGSVSASNAAPGLCVTILLPAERTLACQ